MIRGWNGDTHDQSSESSFAFKWYDICSSRLEETMNNRIRRKWLESDWMNNSRNLLNANNPCVYLPFLKGTSVDERDRMRIYLIE